MNSIYFLIGYLSVETLWLIASCAGIPGIRLPVKSDDDVALPIGLELDGPKGSDRRLLAIAAAVEAALKVKTSV